MDAFAGKISEYVAEFWGNKAGLNRRRCGLGASTDLARMKKNGYSRSPAKEQAYGMLASCSQHHVLLYVCFAQRDYQLFEHGFSLRCVVCRD